MKNNISLIINVSFKAIIRGEFKGTGTSGSDDSTYCLTYVTKVPIPTINLHHATIDC